MRCVGILNRGTARVPRSALQMPTGCSMAGQSLPMTRPLLPDATVAVALAAALGYLLAVPSATAFWTSYVSLTWLLLPFWFGWRARDTKAGGRGRSGHDLGLLAAYYVPPVILIHGGNTDLVARFGSLYFILGAASGPVLGALGAGWQRHPINLIPLGVAGLGLAERWAWQWRVGAPPLSSPQKPSPPPYSHWP